MDIDFDDVLGAELPFLRTNPEKEIEVIELDSFGNVVDVVATSPRYLPALESDYHLEPIIDDTTDEMPYEMSELYPDELGAIFKLGGTIGTSSGVTGSARTSGATRFSINKLAALVKSRAAATAKRRPAKRRPARKPSRAILIAKARLAFKKKRLAKIATAKKQIIKSRPKPTWKGIKLAPSLKVIGAIKAKPSARSVFKEYQASTPARPRPQIVAKPTLATAGLTCGCAQIGRIESMLKKAANQKQATSEHSSIINQSKFRRKTVGQLNAILGRLSSSDRSLVIRAACGMGR